MSNDDKTIFSSVPARKHTASNNPEDDATFDELIDDSEDTSSTTLVYF